MRVAFITVGDTTRLTGGYLYHARVFAKLRVRGVIVDEIVAAGAEERDQAARVAGVGAEFAPHRYDVVVVDALARVVCAPHLDRWRTERPLVAMVHELPSVAADAPQAHADETSLLRADMLIAVSQHGATILEQRGTPPERIRIVSPGRDRVAPAAQAITDRSASAKASPPTALCVAQWIPRKGILTLVEAWQRRHVRDARLVLVGENNANLAYTAEVQRVLARSGDDSIAVCGAVSDDELSALYQSAALFVLPSRYEGYGMVYAEALSHALPVIACAAGPVPELVGSAGLIVPPDNPAALADALDRLLANETMRAELARVARARATQLPTWEDTAAGFERTLQEAYTWRTARMPQSIKPEA